MRPIFIIDSCILDYLKYSLNLKMNHSENCIKILDIKTIKYKQTMNIRLRREISYIDGVKRKQKRNCKAGVSPVQNTKINM